jgi:hypothetical protein
MKKEIVNFTPHMITLVSENGETLRKIASNGVARVSSVETIVSTEQGFPETITEFGEVEGLPAYREDTLVIVSRLVMSRCPNRSDLRCPGIQVRNSEGQVIGCKSLARN